MIAASPEKIATMNAAERAWSEAQRDYARATERGAEQAILHRLAVACGEAEAEYGVARRDAERASIDE